MIAQDVIGVDIAKDWIDAFFLSTARHERIARTKQALARFATAAKGSLVVLEASGGYERPVTDALASAGADYARVNPRQAREFARALGKLAKTDRVDAMVLAEMGHKLGHKLGLKPTPPVDPERVRLSDLVARRAALGAMIRAEKNRAGTTRDSWLSKEVALMINALEDHLGAVEEAIASLIATSPQLSTEARRLRTVPGIGPALVAVILARLPELGQLDEKRIAALAGLAPHACDSGIHCGKRRIWGGRADVRRALYLAGFIASRYDPVIRAFRKRLKAAGKPPKLAITACARKLLTTLNAMLRDGVDHRKQKA